MEPILIEKEKDKYVLTHKCQLCGSTKRNKVENESRARDSASAAHRSVRL
jgi:hypothetical protein